MIGPCVDLRYKYDHIGDSAETLQNLTKHPFMSKLCNAKRPLIIIGADILKRPDAPCIMKAARDAEAHINFLDKSWKILNVLHKTASQVRKIFFFKRL